MLTSPEKISALAAEYGTPFYLLNAAHVIDAMESLRDGLVRYYPNSEITYSVKSNYLAGILRLALGRGYRLEVVSAHELELARRLGAAPGQLLFNGPVKSADTLRLCHSLGIALNVDSLDELAAAAMIGTVARPFRLGVRVMATLSNGRPSRFGIDFRDAGVIGRLRHWMEGGTVCVDGLHVHHSSRRDADSCCDRIDLLVAAAAAIDIRPQYLDIGGGLASVPPPEIAAKLSYRIDGPEELTATIGRHALKILGPRGPRLILEPGIGVLAPAMNYVTSVVAVKARGGDRIAVVDGSMFDVNPLRSAVHPPCHLISRSAAAPADREIPVYGGTCMEIDQLGTLPSAHEPAAGDLVVVTNVGAYSACLAPEFIVPPAPVYDLQSQSLVRQRPSLGQFSGAGA